MIKTVQVVMHEEVMQFLKVEAAINTMMISQIQRFSYDGMLDVYADIVDNEIVGLLTHMQGHYSVYYSNEDFNPCHFKDIMMTNKYLQSLSGKVSIVKHFEADFDQAKTRLTNFCQLKSKDLLVKNHLDYSIASIDDAEKIYDFMADIEGLNGPSNNIEYIEKRIQANIGRIYMNLDMDGSIRAIAQTTSENDDTALIIGLATRSDLRRKGLMSQCLSMLCSDLIDEGKIACLFYDNPKAGMLYHQLGFEHMDKWMMLSI